MMAYVDGFVTPVRGDRGDDYVRSARRMAPLLLEHGALRMVECLDDDVPHGQITDLWRAVAAADGERVAFSWIVWADKAARDEGWKRIMADPRMKPEDDMPFDPKRMIFGGFEIVFDTQQD